MGWTFVLIGAALILFSHWFYGEKIEAWLLTGGVTSVTIGFLCFLLLN